MASGRHFARIIAVTPTFTSPSFTRSSFASVLLALLALAPLPLLAPALAPVASADEGMWPPYSLSQLPFDSLRARGLKLSAEEIYNPGGGGITDAVVHMGATASFVSPEGLLLTNHHVGYGAIQRQSTTEQNYLREGFYAPTRAEEIEAPGYTVDITTGVEDVTERVLGAIDDSMTGIERYNAVDRAIKEIVAEAEGGGERRCKVAATFGGKQYIKYESIELRDVRIVYIPPEAIGNFGGETDNWIWPRHTGDFAFLRAYVGPDGKPAGFSPENVPYRPRAWLPISATGIRDGGFTMTIGFPGHTERYISSFELADQVEFSLPERIRGSETSIRIIEGIGKSDPEIALRTANDLKGIYNWLKKSRGILEGLKRTHALERKLAEEKELTAFLSRSPVLQREYGSVLPDLQRVYEQRKATQLRDSRLRRLNYGCDYYRLAAGLYRWAVEREKPDMERERGYQDRDTLSALRRQRSAQTNLVSTVDRALLKQGLADLLDLPASQRIEALETIFGGRGGPSGGRSIDEFVEDLYARTRIGNLDDRLRMFDMSRRQLQSLHDPFIDLAAALYPQAEEIRERERALDGDEARLTPKLVQAYAEWKAARMYPDANGTMRVSFGKVAGYSPRDAVWYNYVTLLGGVMEKETGADPFIVPAALKAVFAEKDFGPYVQEDTGDVPVDFVTTNDITNGNSGSPVINGRGEIVGIAFDGNYEAVASDYMYDSVMNRTIVVDTRYVLFLLDRVYHLTGLLGELTVR